MEGYLQVSLYNPSGGVAGRSLRAGWRGASWLARGRGVRANALCSSGRQLSRSFITRVRRSPLQDRRSHLARSPTCQMGKSELSRN